MARLCLLVAVVAAICLLSASAVLGCNPQLAPPAPNSPRLVATYFSNGFSYITIEWKVKGEGCVTEYGVETFRASDNQRIGSATVPATSQDSGTFTSQTLTPGASYYFKIVSRNIVVKKESAKINTPTYRAAPGCEVNTRPSTPSDIKLLSNYNDGKFSYITFSWAYTGKGCVDKWLVESFRAADKFRFGSASINATSSGLKGGQYATSTLTPGSSYYFRVAGSNKRGSGSAAQTPTWKAADKPICDVRKAAGLVSNIRLDSTYFIDAKTSFLGITWDYAGAGCVSDYKVETFLVGSDGKGTSQGSSTFKATDPKKGSYPYYATPAKSYFFKITATNGLMGATGSTGSVSSTIFQAAPPPVQPR